MGVNRFTGPNPQALHLIVRSADWLLDLSLDQLNRPERGIILHPLVVQLSHPAWGRVGDQAVVTVNDCIVAYHADPEHPVRYKQLSPDWKDERRRRPVVGAIIREMREKGYA